jgi:hypothetical protein
VEVLVDQILNQQYQALEQVDLEQEHMDLKFILELLDKEMRVDKMEEQTLLDMEQVEEEELVKQDKVILLEEVLLEEPV